MNMMNKHDTDSRAYTRLFTADWISADFVSHVLGSVRTSACVLRVVADLELTRGAPSIFICPLLTEFPVNSLESSKAKVLKLEPLLITSSRGSQRNFHLTFNLNQLLYVHLQLAGGIDSYAVRTDTCVNRRHMPPLYVNWYEPHRITATKFETYLFSSTNECTHQTLRIVIIIDRIQLYLELFIRGMAWLPTSSWWENCVVGRLGWIDWFMYLEFRVFYGDFAFNLKNQFWWGISGFRFRQFICFDLTIRSIRRELSNCDANEFMKCDTKPNVHVVCVCVCLRTVPRERKKP